MSIITKTDTKGGHGDNFVIKYMTFYLIIHTSNIESKSDDNFLIKKKTFYVNYT